MEEDILNYLPTVMFRGTPCIERPNYLRRKHVISTDLVRLGFNPGPGGVRTSSNIVFRV